MSNGVRVGGHRLRGGVDGGGAAMGVFGGRGAAAAGRVGERGGGGDVARAAARERAAVCARVGRAGGSQESAADVVSVGGDAGPVRIDAAVPGRRALGCGAACARLRGAGGARARRPRLGGRRHRVSKDGSHSPGVKRQYSGTLGKVGNCQVTVSVHAVGARGTLPLGWSLYLPEEWCDDRERRQKAKIPEAACFQTKPELAGALCADAAAWEIPAAPILA